MPQLISIKEAAERLSVRPGTVDMMITRGELPAYQYPSGTLRVDAYDIDAFLKACRINNSTQKSEAQ